MKTNELRINNKVLWKDKIWTIIGIDTDPRTPSADSVMLYDENDNWQEVLVSELEGVLLNENMMLQIGFKYYGTQCDVASGYLTMDFKSFSGQCCLTFDCNYPEVNCTIDDDYPFSEGIRELHYLQNLYHLFTGEELNVKNLQNILKSEK